MKAKIEIDELMGAASKARQMPYFRIFSRKEPTLAMLMMN